MEIGQRHIIQRRLYILYNLLIQRVTPNLQLSMNIFVKRIIIHYKKTFVILLMNNIWLVIWYFEISFCLIFQPQTCVKILHSSDKEIKMRDNYSVKMNYSMQTFKMGPQHMLSTMLYFRCISIYR